MSKIIYCADFSDIPSVGVSACYKVAEREGKRITKLEFLSASIVDTPKTRRIRVIHDLVRSGNIKLRDNRIHYAKE